MTFQARLRIVGLLVAFLALATGYGATRGQPPIHRLTVKLVRLELEGEVRVEITPFLSVVTCRHGDTKNEYTRPVRHDVAERFLHDFWVKYGQDLPSWTLSANTKLSPGFRPLIMLDYEDEVADTRVSITTDVTMNSEVGKFATWLFKDSLVGSVLAQIPPDQPPIPSMYLEEIGRYRAQ